MNGTNELYDANGVIGFTNMNIQTEDYITIIKDGSGVGRVRLLPKGTSFIGTMGAIRNTTVDLDYLFYVLLNTDFSKHISGATIPHIYFSDYGENLIDVPNSKEQVQIGAFFRNLDNLITLHQRKCEMLVNIKKSLLEKLYI